MGNIRCRLTERRFHVRKLGMKSTKSLGRTHKENLKLSYLNTKSSSRSYIIKLNNDRAVPFHTFCSFTPGFLGLPTAPIIILTTSLVSHVKYRPFSKAELTHSLGRLLLLNSHFSLSFLTIKNVGESVNSDGEHIQ